MKNITIKDLNDLDRDHTVSMIISSIYTISNLQKDIEMDKDLHTIKDLKSIACKLLNIASTMKHVQDKNMFKEDSILFNRYK